MYCNVLYCIVWYVCRSVCLSVCMSVCMYVLWIGRSLECVLVLVVEWSVSRLSMVNRRRASALLFSTWTLQYGVLSQKGQWFCGPLAYGKMAAWMGGYIYILHPYCTPIRTPHAWLISSVTRRRAVLKSLSLQLHWLNYGESKVLTAACYVYTCP